jgi:hypothetical protein
MINQLAIAFYIRSHIKKGNAMKVKRVMKWTLLGLVLTAIGMISVIVAAQGDTDTEEKIENAMSAAPLAIAQDATILDWPAEEGGEMVVLREGTNGWTCYTDWPDSPGNDPVCNNEAWEAFNAAITAGDDPALSETGVAYMLQGGSDPISIVSNGAAEGDEFVTMPPHIMIVFPEGTDLSNFSTDYTTGGPFVILAGTPYELIIIPVAEWETE